MATYNGTGEYLEELERRAEESRGREKREKDPVKKQIERRNRARLSWLISSLRAKISGKAETPEDF